MDRSKLLEEFATLQRLLKNYENKQEPTINNVKEVGNKVVDNNFSREGSKSTIFFNPKKLNPVHNESTSKVPGKLLDHDSKVLNHDRSNLVAKVFINPYFRKSEMLSSTQSLSIPTSKLEEKQKQTSDLHTSNEHRNQISIPRCGQNDLQKRSNDLLSSQKQKISSDYGCGNLKSKLGEKISVISNNHVIFVNPDFSSSSKLNAGIFNTSSQCIQKKNATGKPERRDHNSNSKSKVTEQKSVINLCRKRKIFMNGDKFTELCVNDQKRRKERENNVSAIKKIFVNPKFERKGSDSKVCESSNISDKIPNMKLNNSFISPPNNGTQALVMSGTSKIPVLIDGKEVSKKLITLTYPICSDVGPDRGKQVGKKTISQRIRTRSTSLVTVSTTKLVRKRKLSQRGLETSGKVSPKPVFISKTKLVRNVSKRNINSSCISKVKAKQLNPKTQVHCVTAEKLYKLRRKSYTDNTLNMITVVPKSAVVTKIKSKNGKSLKLIRKSIDTSLYTTTGEKNKTPVNSRKMELKQQASRIAMCLFQNKLKRNQFSKINVPVKVSHSQSYNKNVYKKNNVHRKPLTKAALVGTKETASVIEKTQIRNTPLDMTKFIKSKYRLIRKQSSITSRYRLRQRIVNKIALQDKLVQRKKLKWRCKRDTSKTRLTRKDLSIKKIGGVFYRYSRTTLTKNKSSSKQVSQLQNKGIYHVLPQRRQNHFCVDKNAGQKRISSVSFITSPSGMSWRKTNYSSARSILTQAKQKSIFMLSKKMRKNNEPCLFFHRYGRCAGRERGTCVRLHDKKYVTVCKKFIQGSCTDAQCSLSHEPSSHNMPTCSHFLAGHCGRDLCPYPHIKVSDCAPICLDFIQGYCPSGDQCAKRHFEICPSFEKGICARGKYCPYPHPKNKMGENLKGKFKRIKRKPQPAKEPESVSTPNLRYFEDVNLQKENQINLSEDEEHEDSDSEVEGEEVSCLKKRPKLGELPSFIPLSSSFEMEDT